MNRKNTFSFFLFFAIAVNAQITITQQAITGPGKTIYTGVAGSATIPAGITAGNAGPGQNWDFSALVPAATDSLVFIHKDSTYHPGLFSNANLAEGKSDFYDYFLNDSSGLYQLGQGGDPYASGDECAASYLPPYKLMQWPATYGQSFTDTLEVIFPPCRTSSVTNDSQAYHAYYTITLSADAWGTLQLPAGTFNCLRFKRTFTYVDTIWSYYNGNPWYPAVILSGSSQQYEWWTNDSTAGYQLAAMTMDTVNNSATYVTWIEIGGTTTALAEQKTGSDCIYPNPAHDYLMIGRANEKKKIIIHDLNGRSVLETEIANEKLDLRSLAPGLYVIKILSGNNFSELKTARLLIR